jgi:hypothetical protein
MVSCFARASEGGLEAARQEGSISCVGIGSGTRGRTKNGATKGSHDDAWR